MRCLLLFTSAFFISAAAFAQQAPGQDVVDQWMSLASKIPAEKLNTGGKHSCASAVEDSGGATLTGYGSTHDEAQAQYLIKCIHHGCSKLGSQLNQAVDKMLSLSEAELRDFAHAFGYSREEIEVLVQRRKQIATESGLQKSNVNCQTASGLTRMYVFDSCAALPLVCRTGE